MAVGRLGAVFHLRGRRGSTQMPLLVSLRAFVPLIACRQATPRTQRRKRKPQGTRGLSAPDLTYAVVGPVELVCTLGLGESLAGRMP